MLRISRSTFCTSL